MDGVVTNAYWERIEFLREEGFAFVRSGNQDYIFEEHDVIGALPQVGEHVTFDPGKIGPGPAKPPATSVRLVFRESDAPVETQPAGSAPRTEEK